MPGRKPDQPRGPSLEDLLSDPITWMVMRSDKVGEHELRELLKHVAAGLRPDRPSGEEESSSGEGLYRKGIGIMLLNASDEVFVGQRADTPHDAWQMPQGGIEENENPQAAAFRELREELGTDNARILAETKTWLRYELPPEVLERWGRRSRWRGQEQKWFVMRFLGTDAEIDIATAQPEFSAWKWIAIDRLPDVIVGFKKQLYADLVQEFGRFTSRPT